MHCNQNHTLSWPYDARNECWVPFQGILCVVDAPVLQNQSGRYYKLSFSDLNCIIFLFNALKFLSFEQVCSFLVVLRLMLIAQHS